MKNYLTILLLLFSVSLFAQQKGAGPLPKSEFQNPKSATFAVVVGISDYQDPTIPDLRFADRDAQAFANFLRSPAGGALDEDHLKVLINEEATAGKVAANLYWLMDECKEGDQAIIYFSGHGDAEDRFKRQPGFLLCWDAPAKVYLAGGVIDLRLLQDVISSLSLDTKARVLVVTDACRSGKLSGSDYGGAQVTAASLQKQFANEIKILSCQPDEYSIEGKQWGGGRGAFSYHLLDGLYGMADGNADGVVDLKEIGRYLEDKVAQEVAPEHQNPMTIGSRTEKLTDVFPELLAELKEGRKGQLQLFTPTDSRGIEAEVLARADSNVVEMYRAFQVALAEKHFLGPERACADYYFGILSQEPQLERLHSSMRRNYAAALQDDAQQLLNLMLKGGFTARILKGTVLEYSQFPAYLEKAAELLGPENYMYPILRAREYFFKGYLTEDLKESKNYLLKALEWQPDMPHAYAFMIRSFRENQGDKENQDSILYYFNKATELVPSWSYPYIILGNSYYLKRKYAKAEEILEQAVSLDPNHQYLKFVLAAIYAAQKKYELAEPMFEEVLASMSPDICFPCAQSMLAAIYRNTGHPDKAIKYLEEKMQLDSTNGMYFNSLGWNYFLAGRYEEAAQKFQHIISIDSQFVTAYNNLGLLYAKTGKYSESEKYLSRANELSPKNAVTHIYCAVLYSIRQQTDKAFEYLELGLKYGYNNPPDDIDINEYPELAPLREQKERWDALMKEYFPDH
ncbi:MAG: tetratricopeptide repeat protein [Saprospiraceae bacterium]|nr:tetratricopeptide repeat protein [Saprospiraceae bacterium]